MQTPTVLTTKPNWPHIAWFLGMTPESPWPLYLGLALVLMVVAVLARQIQLKTR